jgi:hypothetical protein
MVAFVRLRGGTRGEAIGVMMVGGALLKRVGADDDDDVVAGANMGAESCDDDELGRV